MGLPPLLQDRKPVIGVSVFWSTPFLGFTSIMRVSQDCSPRSGSPTARIVQYWSVLGTALIISIPIFGSVSVAINAWYGPFYDLIQQALAAYGAGHRRQLYSGMVGFSGLPSWRDGRVLNLFFVSHYIFRWRRR